MIPTKRRNLEPSLEERISKGENTDVCDYWFEELVVFVALDILTVVCKNQRTKREKERSHIILQK